MLIKNDVPNPISGDFKATYKLALQMQEGFFFFMLRTDYVMEVPDNADSDRLYDQAYSDSGDILRFVRAYFDRNKRDIVIEIKPNCMGITKAEAYQFKWYDETICSLNNNHGTFAPEAFVNISRQEFIAKFLQDYGKYKFTALNFDCVAFQILQDK